MSRTKKTTVTPNGTRNAPPKTSPINKPTRTSKREPKAAPKAAPKPRPTRTLISEPIITPDNYTLSIYALPNWADDHSINPHKYGNGGRALGEFHTEADAKQWLRDNDQYGHFAAVERIAGRIGKSWHVEIEPPDNDAGDDDLIDDELGMLDPDLDVDDADLMNPAIVRAKIENAKLRAELNASRNGAHGSITELLEGVKMIEELRRQAAPQRSLVEEYRAAKELVEMVTPRREPNPAPATQQIDPEASVFQMLARDGAFVDKIADGIIGKLVRGESSKDESGWETVAMEAIRSGQAAAMVNSLMSGLQGIVAMILPPKTQQQTMPAHPDQRAQHAPAIQAQQLAPQVMPEAAQPATAEGAQQPAPEIAKTGDPYTAMLTDVITTLMRNDPVDGAIKRVDGFILLAPQYAEFINGQFAQDAETLLGAISAIPGCEQIAQLPHAKGWIEQFQAGFFDEEGEEASEDSPAEEGKQ